MVWFKAVVHNVGHIRLLWVAVQPMTSKMNTKNMTHEIICFANYLLTVSLAFRICVNGILVIYFNTSREKHKIILARADFKTVLLAKVVHPMLIKRQQSGRVVVA